MNRQIESMRRFEYGPYIVRVWRTAADLEEAESHGRIYPPRGLSRVELAKWVAKEIPKVSAVEVIDQHGNGVLIYPDWY